MNLGLIGILNRKGFQAENPFNIYLALNVKANYLNFFEWSISQ